MYYKSKKKGERKQINIRVPIFIDNFVLSQSEVLNLSKNDMYVVMLYDYVQNREKRFAERKD